MKRIFQIFAFLIITTNSYSKNKPVPPILEKLSSLKGSIQIQNLFVDNWIKIDNLPLNFNNSLQKIIKTKNDIFLNIDGTGRLYKLVIKENSYHFIRIDSTYYTGYNFGSILFDYKDTIYSFGGEGFWNTNGDLRLFDKFVTHEWHAHRLNKLIYGSFSDNEIESQFYFYNQNNHSLIISYPTYSQSHILKNEINDSSKMQKLFQLDVIKGEWSELGIKNFKSNQHIAFTPYGILSKGFIVDISKNKIYKYKNNLLDLFLLKSSGDNKVSITFCKDSILYFGNSSGYIDSVCIRRSNLIDTGEPAYFPVKPETTLSKEDLLFYSLIATSTLSLGMIFLHFKKRNLTKNQIQKSAFIIPEKQQVTTDQSDKEKTVDNPIYRSGKLVELMNEQEISFLRYLYAHSMDERMTTIDEINRKLGTFNKTVEIQKKMRSDMINGINSKLSTFSKSSKPVIDKQRSEFDKRSFEYFIHPDHTGLVGNIIKANKN